MTQHSPLPRPVLAAILGQTLISAGTHLAAKQATASFTPGLLVTLRLVAAALVFAAILAALPGRRLPPRHTWPWLVGFGFIAGPLNQGLFMYGLQSSKATHGALLYALTPIGVYLLAVARGREVPRARRLWGIGLAFSGVVVLLLGRGLREALGPLLGDLFILGAVASWVVWTTESKPFATEHGGLRTAAWSLLVAGLWTLPAAPFTVTAEALAAVTPVGWACLVYLVLMTSVLSYALWNYALARVEPSRVAIFTNLQPVATALAAWALLGEPLTWESAAGGALVLLGVRVAQH